MSNYGSVPKGPELKAQFQRQKLGTFPFQIFPEFWSQLDCRFYYESLAWNEVYFTAENQTAVPSASGIYMFVANSAYTDILQDHSYILYVGKSKNLNTRYKTYLKEQRYMLPHNRAKVSELLDYFDSWLLFKYVTVPEADLPSAEDLLKDNLTPPGNSQLNLIGRLQTSTPA